jgi:hypothetical protein
MKAQMKLPVKVSETYRENGKVSECHGVSASDNESGDLEVQLIKCLSR